MNYVKEALNTAYALLKQTIEEKEIHLSIEALTQKIVRVFQNGNKILISGNGGSTCDAMHFAEEFTGRFRKDRPALPVIALSDPAYLTCVGNDYGFDQIFSRGVEALGKKNDIYIGISTSGNSENVYNAILAAKKLGMNTCAFLGKTGGKIKGLCDYELIVPGTTTDRIQEIHIKLLHIVIEGVERQLYPELYCDD